MNRLHSLHHLHRHLCRFHIRLGLTAAWPTGCSYAAFPACRPTLRPRPGWAARVSRGRSLGRGGGATASSTWETPGSVWAGVTVGNWVVAGKVSLRHSLGPWAAGWQGGGVFLPGRTWAVSNSERKGRRLHSAGAHFARPLRSAQRGLHSSGTALWGNFARNNDLFWKSVLKQLRFYFILFYFQVTTLESLWTTSGCWPDLTSILVTSALDAPGLPWAHVAIPAWVSRGGGPESFSLTVLEEE